MESHWLSKSLHTDRLYASPGVRANSKHTLVMKLSQHFDGILQMCKVAALIVASTLPTSRNACFWCIIRERQGCEANYHFLLCTLLLKSLCVGRHSIILLSSFCWEEAYSHSQDTHQWRIFSGTKYGLQICCWLMVDVALLRQRIGTVTLQFRLDGQ